MTAYATSTGACVTIPSDRPGGAIPGHSTR